ncbi:MAG: DHA2 family efflux MFS transporter permease subunit [Actinomycetaceae bacterium]|nr:DHA2 family efflux MFS transporter permease subunit [Actinomycetaceae bacterium]
MRNENERAHEVRPVHRSDIAYSGSNADHKWAGLLVLALGLSLIVVDGTIVGVSMPVISKDLSLNIADAQWVNSLYNVVFAALLLTAGRLGDRFGRRKLFIVGLAIFIVASAAASMAHTIGFLVAARAVQGVGAAAILPSTISNLNATFRGRERAIAFGIWGATMSAAAAVGPLLGGWLTTLFTWPWIFLVNVPTGLLIIVLAFLVVPETTGNTSSGLDGVGTLLSSLGFGLIVFGVIEGQSLGWIRPISEFRVLGLTWSMSAVLSAAGCAIVCGVLVSIVFLAWEQRRADGEGKLLDLQLFRIASFSWGSLALVVINAAEFVLIFLLPLYLVNVLGLSTMGAGWVLASLALGSILAGASVRHLSRVMSSATIVLVGAVLELASVAFTAAILSPTTRSGTIAIVMAVYGAGVGLTSAQLTSLVLIGVPPEDSGMASATQSTLRQLGSAVGSAVGGTILAASIAQTAPSRLMAIRGITQPVAEKITRATVDSVGGVISGLRQPSAAAHYGPDARQMADVLAQSFSMSTSAGLWLAAGMLACGLAASVVLWRIARNIDETK